MTNSQLCTIGALMGPTFDQICKEADNLRECRQPAVMLNIGRHNMDLCSSESNNAC